MLIIANGAFKSGSTWQYQILQQLTQFSPIPEAYQVGWVNSSVDIDKIQAFLSEVDITSENYLSKNHIGSKQLRDLLLGNQNVRVFNIERDIRDVLVSAYHHHLRRIPETGTFETYFYKYGLNTVNDVLSYHQMWNASDSPQYFVGSYDALHNDFDNEVRRMATFLDISLSDDELEAIKARTSLGSLREAYGESDKSEEERFFRKGESGDWVNYFDDAMLEALTRLENQYNGQKSLLATVSSKLKQLLRL